MVANLHLTTCIGSSRGIQIQPAHPQNLSAFGFVYNGLLPLMLWFYDDDNNNNNI